MIEFIILGDMGSGEPSQYSVAKQMKKKIKNNNMFICGLGDNIYECGVSSVNDEQFNTKFELPYKDINIPFYMCLGNHDYGYSNKCLVPKENAFNQIRYSHYSDKWIMPKRYYTFSKKDGKTKIDFFVLDTNLEFYDDKENEKQKNDMIDSINKSDGDWKIVYGHHTLRSVGGHGNAEDIFEDFMKDLFRKAPFDVYMCGHDHNKQVINMKIDNKPLLLIVCGTGGKKYHNEICFENMEKDTCDLECCSNNLGYGHIKINEDKLCVEFLDDNNKSEYICYINKKI